MKFIAVIILLACFQAAAFNGNAQRVTLDFKDAALEKVFKEIEKQAKYTFLYNSWQVQNSRPVTIHLTDATVSEALTVCLRDQKLTFTIATDKVIVIREKEEKPKKEDEIHALPPIDITGQVINSTGEPVVGASVEVRGTKIGTTTDANGFFKLTNIDENATLIISAINIETIQIRVNKRNDLSRIFAVPKIKQEEVVTVSTGYQQIPKERATGSFEVLNIEELNRRVGTDILSRLEGVTNSVLFDKRTFQPTQNSIDASNIIIRGVSTLTNDIKSPLIILNNFPYDGNILNINPNDVESITILKDAAAASIWGARAGNGVIIITTKNGKLNQPISVSVNSNVNIISKPDLYSFPSMSTSEYIEVETFLFNRGFYNANIGIPTGPALTPIIDLLARRRSGGISAEDSATQMNYFRNQDVRRDFDSYIYRDAVNYQTFLNVSGGSEKLKYAFSGGLDKNIFNLKGNDATRVTFRSDNSLSLSKRLEVAISVAYTSSNATNNALGDFGSTAYNYTPTKRLYPYARFTDELGNIVALPHEYRTQYLDSAGDGKLLNWEFNPISEINELDNTNKLEDILLTGSLKYKISEALSASFAYQYERGNLYNRNYYSDKTYFTRNMINLFTNISDNNIIHNVPLGGILDELRSSLTSRSGRVQINYSKNWNSKHDITAIVGGELRDKETISTTRRLYGYNENNVTFSNVNYLEIYSLYGGLGSSQIQSGDSYGKLTDRFVSAFGNIAYSYKKRYTFSASGRRDASNIFGVDINNKWKPLWSIGGAWNTSNESFFSAKLINALKFRATYGYQGNVNNSISPSTIINIANPSSSIINQPFALISRGADPSLSWETIEHTNVGVELSAFNNRIDARFDAYLKNCRDLIFNALLDPTTGMSAIARNSASMQTKGLELYIVSRNIQSDKFSWRTEFSFSYVSNKVTDYELDDGGRSVSGLAGNGLSILPVKGNSLYGIYSFPFLGLDSLNGDPIGRLGKSPSKSYAAIMRQQLDTADIIYHGSGIPTKFGFLNNSFMYGAFNIDISISYRLGYYFRKNSISYFGLYRQGISHPDFSRRWKKSGDEKSTSVPSMIYPINNENRDAFYARSSVNVYKGDHIRLEYIRFSYTPRIIQKSKSSLLKKTEIYFTCSNLGIIWRANKESLDPDFNIGNALYPRPVNYAFGVNLAF